MTDPTTAQNDADIAVVQQGNPYDAYFGDGPVGDAAQDAALAAYYGALDRLLTQGINAHALPKAGSK
jgi:hypothetical protein